MSISRAVGVGCAVLAVTVLWGVVARGLPTTAAGLAASAAGLPPAAGPTVTVDVGADRGAATQVASGSARKPSLFGPATGAPLAATGANLMVGLDRYTGDPAGPYLGYRPGDGGDFATWIKIVNGVLAESAAKQNDVRSWITWNEPDVQWAGRYPAYYEAHKAAYDAVKARNPRLVVQAPELSTFDWAMLTEFLTYCRDNNCLPDVLSWRERELDGRVTDVPDHTARITAWMKANAITPMPIAITEHQGVAGRAPQADTVGQNVRWLAQLERSVPHGLRAAVYSDLRRSNGNPLLEATSGQAADRLDTSLPDASWWSYNAYKSMTGRMVDVASSDVNVVDGLGSVDAGLRRAVVLIGNQTGDAQPVSLSLRGLTASSPLVRAGTVHVLVERIDDSAAFAAPSVVVDRDVAVTDGEATLSLGPVGARGAYKVLITPATSDAPLTSFEAGTLATTAGGGLSVGPLRHTQTTAPGQWLEFSVPVVRTGVYALQAVLSRDDSRAIQMLYLNGRQFGAPQDGWGPFGYHRVHYGTVRLTAGTHTLRFVAVGRNPRSSGWTMDFERFDLRRLDQVSTSVSVTTPVSQQVIQRSAANTAAVDVRGTAPGADAVEARLVPQDGTIGSVTAWTPLGAPAADGAFAGTVPKVGPGWYALQVRAVRAGQFAGLGTTERVGVGDVFLVAGQSNSANYGATRQVPSDDRVSAPTIGYTGWQSAADPQPNAKGRGGSPWPAFGSRYAATRVPVGVVAVGVGGTSVQQWLPGGALFPRLQAAAKALGGNGFRGVLWHQGEQDSRACTPSATYAARLQKVIQGVRDQAGWEVPWGIATVSRMPKSRPECMAAVEAGQALVVSSTAATFAGPDTDPYAAAGLIHGSVHLNARGLTRHGLEWVDAVVAAEAEGLAALPPGQSATG